MRTYRHLLREPHKWDIMLNGILALGDSEKMEAHLRRLPRRAVWGMWEVLVNRLGVDEVRAELDRREREGK